MYQVNLFFPIEKKTHVVNLQYYAIYGACYIAKKYVNRYHIESDVMDTNTGEILAIINDDGTYHYVAESVLNGSLANTNIFRSLFNK